jgi:site-specific recombinase XerD
MGNKENDALLLASRQNRTAVSQPTTIHTYLHAATSQNTRRAYQSDIRHFISCGGRLPSSADELLRYLQENATALNPRTLKRRLVAIKHWHTYQGFPDPTAHPLIRKTLSGILHIHGKPLKKVPPFSLEHLQLLTHYLKSRGELADWRNNALLQVGFFGAFRRSELVAMYWEHVSFVPKGVEILIPRGKTDQEGKGNVCAIPYGNSVLCPVTALHQWHEKSEASIGPIFCRIMKGNKLKKSAISSNSINKIIKSIAIACELPQGEIYSGHSLRRGFATTASQKGASFSSIMRQGRWRHEGTVHGYIEEGSRFDANAAGSILDDIKPSMISEVPEN